MANTPFNSFVADFTYPNNNNNNNSNNSLRLRVNYNINQRNNSNSFINQHDVEGGEEDEDASIMNNRRRRSATQTYLNRHKHSKQHYSSQSDSIHDGVWRRLHNSSQRLRSIAWFIAACKHLFEAAAKSTDNNNDDNSTTSPAPPVSAKELRALYLLHRSHLLGFSLATAVYGFFNEFGMGGLEINFREAERLYTLAANKGNGLAQARLAFLKTHGRPNVKINHCEAESWRTACKSQGMASVAWLQLAADANVAPAQFCLALCYYNGIAIESNDADAFKWCERSAQLGHPGAQNVLGNLFIEGTGCVTNHRQGLQWYIKAAEMKEAAAMYNIGTLFERGLAVEADVGQAFEWYVRAAVFGSVNAQNVLGIFHEQGIGATRNQTRAVQYYRTAALSGHPHAIYNLGRCYHEGIGVIIDNSAAVSWWNQGAMQGHDLSLLSMAFCSEGGVGMKRDWTAAKKFYRRAVLRESVEAKKRLVPVVAGELMQATRILLCLRGGAVSTSASASVAAVTSPSAAMFTVDDMDDFESLPSQLNEKKGRSWRAAAGGTLTPPASPTFGHGGLSMRYTSDSYFTGIRVFESSTTTTTTTTTHISDLPVEIIMHILSFIDDMNILSDSKKRSIISVAADRSTLRRHASSTSVLPPRIDFTCSACGGRCEKLRHFINRLDQNGDSSHSSRNPEFDRLWAVVTTNPDDFSAWETLITTVEITHGGIRNDWAEEDMSRFRRVYDHFLAKFPLVYGYWKKYADAEMVMDGVEKAESTFERGVQAITNSVPLWTQYCTFKMEHSTDEVAIRAIFERAVESAGYDFVSHPIWDKYIEFEESKPNGHTLGVLERVIRVPLQEYVGFFEKYSHFSVTRPVTELLPVEEIDKLQSDIRDSHMKILTDSEMEHELRQRIHAIKSAIYMQTQEQVHKRWAMENEITRRYFHVKPLDPAQLQVWRKYLDFEEKEAETSKETKALYFLYERCLVSCALYEEFWIRYVRLLLESNDISAARGAFTRATAVFLAPSRTELRLMFAAFEEEHGDPEAARKEYKQIMDNVPGHIGTISKYVHFERRQAGTDRALEMIQCTLGTLEKPQPRAYLTAYMAKLIAEIKGDVEAARTVYKENLGVFTESKYFLLSSFLFEMGCSGYSPDHVTSIWDAIKKSSAFEFDEKREIGSRYLDYHMERSPSISIVNKIEADLYKEYSSQVVVEIQHEQDNKKRTYTQEDSPIQTRAQKVPKLESGAATPNVAITQVPVLAPSPVSANLRPAIPSIQPRPAMPVMLGMPQQIPSTNPAVPAPYYGSAAWPSYPYQGYF